jgi:hypothetical protein
MQERDQVLDLLLRADCQYYLARAFKLENYGRIAEMRSCYSLS